MRILADFGGHFVRVLLDVSLFAAFGVFLLSLFALSPMAAPAAVAAMTLGICSIAVRSALRRPRENSRSGT